MFILTIVTLLALGCNVHSYASFHAAVGPAFTQPIVPPMVQSYGTKMVAPVAYAVPQQTYGPIEAAVHSRRTVEVRELAVPRDYIQPQIIEVSADQMPVQIHFKSSSSPVTVQQSHTPGIPYPVEHNSYQEQPHRLVNEVVKPVIQEVREIIQPYRRVTQEIRPVVEEVHTLLHKGLKAYQQPYVQQPLPLAVKAPASYGSGAALAVNAGYKAAKAAAKA